MPSVFVELPQPGFNLVPRLRKRCIAASHAWISNRAVTSHWSQHFSQKAHALTWLSKWNLECCQLGLVIHSGVEGCWHQLWASGSGFSTLHSLLLSSALFFFVFESKTSFFNHSQQTSITASSLPWKDSSLGWLQVQRSSAARILGRTQEHARCTFFLVSNTFFCLWGLDQCKIFQFPP